MNAAQPGRSEYRQLCLSADKPAYRQSLSAAKAGQVPHRLIVVLPAIFQGALSMAYRNYFTSDKPRSYILLIRKSVFIRHLYKQIPRIYLEIDTNFYQTIILAYSVTLDYELFNYLPAEQR